MTDIASLGIEVQTGDVTKAGDELDKFVQAGERAEKAAEGIGQSFGKTSTAATSLAGAETKLGESTEDAKTRLLAMAKASLDSSEYLKSLTSSVNSSTSAIDASRATTTDYAALARRMKAESDALVGTVDQQAEATRRAAAATGVQADGLAKLLGQINPTAAALARLDEQQRLLSQHRAVGNIDADGFKAYTADIEVARGKIKGFRDETVGAKGATDNFSLSTKGAQQNVLQLINALSSGNWTSGLHAIARLGIGAGISGAGISSLFSSGAGAAELGDSLESIATKSKDVAENAGEAGKSISDLAEKSNTAAESTGYAKKALEALGASTGPVGIGMAALVVGVAAAAAAVGVLVYGYYQGSKEADEYNKSLILTGNYAGTSAGQLADLARQVSATNGTTGQAAASLATLAGSGVIASSSFKEIADAAAAMEDATGRSVEATIAEFVKIAKDPVAAAKELNDQYHFLTASVYSQIVALKEQGDTIGAAKLLTDTYADTVKTRSGQITDNLGYVEKAWKGITDEAKKSLDAVKNFGREAGPAERIAELTNVVAYGRSAVQADPDDTDAAKKLAAAEKELQALTKLRDIKEKEAAEQARTQAIQDKAQDSQRTFDAREKSFRTNKQKRDEELKELDRELQSFRAADPKDPRLEQSRVDLQRANINAKFKDPKAASAGAVDLTEFNASQNAIKTILAEYANAQKELDALQKAGLVSQEEYGWKRAGMIGNQKDEITAAYEAEISALESAKARKTTSAAQSIELDKKIADARTDMVKAQKDADSQLEVLKTNETGRLNQLRVASEAYVTQLERQRAALESSGSRAASALGLGDRQAGLQSSLDGVADKFNGERDKLLDRRKTAPDKYSQEDYLRDLSSLEDAEKKYRDTVVDNYSRMSIAQGEWQSGATSAFQNYLESARDISGQTKALFGNAFSSMEDAVVNFAITGKASFGDFTKSILADMARIATRQAASGLLSSLAGSALGAYFGGGTNSGINGFSDYGEITSIPGRASGGSVDPNSLYEVNEKGPELFSQGGRSYLMTGADGGSVTPLTTGGGPAIAAMAGRGMGEGNTYNFPIVVQVDASGQGGSASADGMSQESLGRSIQSVTRAEAEKAIVAGLRQGGPIWRAIRGS